MVTMDHSLNQTSHSSHTSKTAMYGEILLGVTNPTHFAVNTADGSYHVHSYVNMVHSLNQTSHSSHTSKTAIYGQILVGVTTSTHFAANTILETSGRILLMALTTHIYM